MNQLIAALSAIFVIGLSYFLCAMFKHGNCDIGKIFNLLIIAGSLVTGIYLCIHAVELAKASQVDSPWIGIAGLILSVFSVQQTVISFKELFAKKVEPRKVED